MEKEEKSNSLVSVIIPVYNSESTLKRCIESVVRQNYSNIEVILIDNGSEDHGKSIIEQYAQSDSRIQSEECCHGTVSMARNIGLEKAKGKYIQFVDSDDYLEKECIDKLVNQAEKSSEPWVICDYIQFNEENQDIKHFHLTADRYSRRQFVEKMMRCPAAHYYGVLWNKLYCSEIIKENNIRFPEDVCMGEDFIFNMEYLKYVERIECLSDKLYYYWWKRVGSLSNIEKREEDVIHERIKMYHAYEDLFKCLKMYRWKKNRIRYYIVKFYFDELELLGEEGNQYKEILYKKCIIENGISKYNFAIFYLLKKVKKWIHKREKGKR